MAARRTRSACWFAPGLLFLAGCASMSTFDPPQPGPEPAAKTPPANLELLRSAKDLGWDYVYPEGLTTHVIRWTQDPIEWRLRLASKRYAYAGITLRKPYDFSPHRDKTTLTFRLEPAMMARYITLGLVDGDQSPNHTLVDLPLGRYVRDGDEGVATVRIPLSDFGDEGLPVVGPGEAPHEAGRVPFDWTDVREIRVSSSGTIPRREFVISGIRFRR